MKVFIEPGAFLPERAYDLDAGFDLRAMEAITIPPHSHVVVHTGVHIELPENTAGILISKSGLNTKFGVTSTGLIDEGYTGEILVPLHNNGDLPFVVSKEQKISQLVITSIFRPKLELVESCEAFKKSDRGNSGFGSTGAF